MSMKRIPLSVLIAEEVDRFWIDAWAARTFERLSVGEYRALCDWFASILRQIQRDFDSVGELERRWFRNSFRRSIELVWGRQIEICLHWSEQGKVATVVSLLCLPAID